MISAAGTRSDGPSFLSRPPTDDRCGRGEQLPVPGTHVFGPFRRGEESAGALRPSPGQPWTRALFWSAKDPRPATRATAAPPTTGHATAPIPPPGSERDTWDPVRGERGVPPSGQQVSITRPATPLLAFRQSAQRQYKRTLPNLRLAFPFRLQSVFVCQPPRPLADGGGRES